MQKRYSNFRINGTLSWNDTRNLIYSEMNVNAQNRENLQHAIIKHVLENDEIPSLA